MLYCVTFKDVIYILYRVRISSFTLGSQPRDLPMPPIDRGKIRRADSEDVQIGQKIRALRLDRGLSQKQVAAKLGVSFQQLQKYERGANRVSAGRLQRVADALGVSVTFFYAAVGSSKSDRAHVPELAYLRTRGAVRLLRAYAAISAKPAKLALVVLAESLRDKQRG